MTHQVHPYIFRTKETKDWKSRWFNLKKYKDFLRQDIKLREFIMNKLKGAGIDKIEIERLSDSITIIISTARPGLVIGRGGQGIEELRQELKNILIKEGVSPKTELKLEVREIREPEISAAVMAQIMAEQIEKRVPFRRVMKQALKKIMSNKKVKGARVQIKGRLDGAEMARTEWLKEGRLPLQTLRSDIDYATSTAYTTYGTVGIKVWIYKGEKF
ncbi:30S ribosomal protein S3 [bacterium]|nr:30S ribosomal protein S3 [bacterium]